MCAPVTSNKDREGPLDVWLVLLQTDFAGTCALCVCVCVFGVCVRECVSYQNQKPLSCRDRHCGNAMGNSLMLMCWVFLKTEISSRALDPWPDAWFLMREPSPTIERPPLEYLAAFGHQRLPRIVFRYFSRCVQLTLKWNILMAWNYNPWCQGLREPQKRKVLEKYLLDERQKPQSTVWLGSEWKRNVQFDTMFSQNFWAITAVFRK